MENMDGNSKHNAESENMGNVPKPVGGRIESIYQPYIDGLKELREINADYTAPFVRG